MERDPRLVKFGKNVRRLRIERGLTQRALAEKSDLDESAISRVELGKFNPSFIWFIRLAIAFEMTPDQLMLETMKES